MRLSPLKFPCLAALLAACLVCSCHTPDGSPRMIIPVQVTPGNKILVPTSLGPAILDTGAPMSLVDEEFAIQHGLKALERTVTVHDVSGAKAHVRTAIVPRLSIPTRQLGKRWELRDIEVVVVKGFKQRQMGSSFLLGLPAIADRIVELNLEESEIRILGGLPYGPNCKRVPLRVAETGGIGGPAVPVEVPGLEPFYGILDTGHGGYFSLGGNTWGKMPIRKGSVKTGRGGGFLREAPFKKARSSEPMAVGNIVIYNCPVSEAHGRNWEHNLIGVAVWKHMRVALDWRRKEVVFSTPGRFHNQMWLNVGE